MDITQGNAEVGESLRGKNQTKDFSRGRCLNRPYSKRNGLKRALTYSVENKDIMRETVGVARKLMQLKEL